LAPEQAVGGRHRAMDDSPPPETQRAAPSPDAKISKSPATSRKLEVSGHSGDPQTDLDDPSLANADIKSVKNKAEERVNTLITDLETGSFGASKFDVEFRKAWPYAQGHFGKAEEPAITVFPELIKSVCNHPLAKQHGEFTL